MTHSKLEAALAIARSRHTALLDGDVEVYASLEDDLAATCSAIASAALNEADIPVLNELIGIESQSRTLLQTLIDETSARLESLQHHTHANRAYSRVEPLFVNGT